jgi:hypothetical protein
MFKRTSLLAAVTAAVFSLALASAAQAQAPWWGQDDDRDRRDRRDRRRDDDYRNDRNGGYGRYDTRTLRDVAERIKDRSKDLERDVDRLLDNSRANGTDREDRVNDQARDFRNAADRFKSRVGDGRDPNRAANEARELLQRGQQIDRLLSRLRADSRTQSDWSQISRDLHVVADIYGVNYRADDGGYNRGGYDPRYPDNGRNRDNRNRNRNDGWWRRIPEVLGRP